MTIWSTEWQTSKPKDQGTDTPTDIPIYRISSPQFEMNSKTKHIKRVTQCPFKRLTSNKSKCYFIGNLDVNSNQIPASTQYGCDRKTTFVSIYHWSKPLSTKWHYNHFGQLAGRWTTKKCMILVLGYKKVFFTTL